MTEFSFLGQLSLSVYLHVNALSGLGFCNSDSRANQIMDMKGMHELINIL